MSMANGGDWETATTMARTLKDQGAIFHRTIRSNVWWVDPVPDLTTENPATFWVTLHTDGCYSCVEGKSPSGPCAHIARVCLETGAPPMIWTENHPSDPRGHNKRIRGYTKEALHHPECGCSG
jgi:hypothetical protein